MISAKILLFGRVQMVGCRSFVQSIAKEMGVRGTVKNLSDGSVQIVCECENENVFEEFKSRIAKGNFLIKVDRLKIQEKRNIEKSEFSSFNIEY